MLMMGVHYDQICSINPVKKGLVGRVIQGGNETDTQVERIQYSDGFIE